jgi:hypothetical protein
MTLVVIMVRKNMNRTCDNHHSQATGGIYVATDR